MAEIARQSFDDLDTATFTGDGFAAGTAGAALTNAAASFDPAAHLRIPEHPVARSDDIRSGIPGYPVTLSARL